MPNRPLIFIADDAQEAIAAIRTELEPAYRVHSTLHLSEAIDTLRDVRIHGKNLTDRYAVAIIDLEFVVVGKVHSDAGIRILEEAIKDPFLEPIIFTGHGNEELAERASKLGMFRYIKKFERNTETSMATVREAVDFAVAHRQNIIELKQCIDDFHHKMVLLSQSGDINKMQFKHLTEMHKHGVRVFDGMLRARGRRPTE